MISSCNLQTVHQVLHFGRLNRRILIWYSQTRRGTRKWWPRANPVYNPDGAFRFEQLRFLTATRSVALLIGVLSASSDYER